MRPSPTLTTLHRIERILRAAAQNGERPLGLAEIERRLLVKKMHRTTLKAAVQELKRFRLVAEGEKGIMWIVPEDDSFFERRFEPLE